MTFLSFQIADRVVQHLEPKLRTIVREVLADVGQPKLSTSTSHQPVVTETFTSTAATPVISTTRRAGPRISTAEQQRIMDSLVEEETSDDDFEERVRRPLQRRKSAARRSAGMRQRYTADSALLKIPLRGAFDVNLDTDVPSFLETKIVKGSVERGEGTGISKVLLYCLQKDDDKHRDCGEGGNQYTVARMEAHLRFCGGQATMLKCHYCKGRTSTFRSIDSRENHMVAKHGFRSSGGEDVAFSCPYCERGVGSMNALNDHLIAAHKASVYHCEHVNCRHTFTTLQGWKDHVQNAKHGDLATVKAAGSRERFIAPAERLRQLRNHDNKVTRRMFRTIRAMLRKRANVAQVRWWLDRMPLGEPQVEEGEGEEEEEEAEQE